MGEVLCSMWKNGPPEMIPCLKFLVGWQREELIDVVQRFRNIPSLAVNQAEFARILGKELTDKETREIFAALGVPAGRKVDFLSVILPMVMVSDQSYISKITFLFSVADFNSSTTINRAELYIAMRSLFKGLSRFYPSALPPCGVSLEQATSRTFAQIDADNSLLVDLEEILVFAYRSRGLRVLMAPFPGKDHRNFEELIVFVVGDKEHLRRSSQLVEHQQESLTKRLMLTPDPGPSTRSAGTKKRQRPWVEPAIITKPRVFMVRLLFNELQTGAQVKCKALLEFTSNAQALEEALRRGASELVREKMVDSSDHAAEQKVGSYIKCHLLAVSSIQKLKELPPAQDLSLRAVLSILWPNVQEREISQSLRWCRRFQAVHALRELLKPTRSALTDESYNPPRDALSLRVTDDDLESLFDVIDVDGNGKLSLQELITIGQLSEAEAKHLQTLWDRDHDGDLTKGDLLAIVKGINQNLRREIKGMFAASLGRPGEQSP